MSLTKKQKLAAVEAELDGRIHPEYWIWFGNAGHFICAQWCRFHLCTQVGKFLVSTVGEYVPDETSREIHCTFRKIKLEGMGDDRLNDYMKKVGFQEIGAGRKYETYVFNTKPGKCSCGCGMPNINFSEIAGQGANDATIATTNHMRMCEEFSKKK